jgi:hypothetical protein
VYVGPSHNHAGLYAELSHAHAAQYAELSHTHTGGQITSSVNSAVNAEIAASVPWSGVTGKPGGFADGVDNDTVYSVGTGLSRAGTEFSIANGGVGPTQLATAAVGTAQIAANAVTTDKILDGTIGPDDLGAVNVLRAEDGNPAVALHVNADGWVTVGGTSPESALEVNGDVTLQGFSALVNIPPRPVFRTYHRSLDFYIDDRTRIDGENTKQASIRGTYGGVLVYTNLWVPGMAVGAGTVVQITASGQLVKNTSSSRYKQSISPLQEDFDRLMDLEPKRFKYNSDSERWQVGYIAEEVDAAGLENLVHYDQSGQPDSVDYAKMVIYANELLKKQRDLLDEQRAEIGQLRQLVIQMQDRLNALDQVGR